MTNTNKSNVSEKSKGFLLFAYNTAETDYVSIAERCARLATHTTGLPVSLVTEEGTQTDYSWDNVITKENTLKNYKVGELGAWRNGGRYNAYDLTPYDETIVIDADYFVIDKNLLKLLEQDFDYRIMQKNNLPGSHWNLSMSIVGLPYVWATVIIFRKTAKSKMLFDLVKRVQRNYEYYRRLYHMREGNFRNDYAFTIANVLLNGYDLNEDQGIPWNMLTFAGVIKSIELHNNLLKIREDKKGYAIPKQDIHVMDKGFLLSENCQQLVDQLCDA